MSALLFFVYRWFIDALLFFYCVFREAKDGQLLVISSIPRPCSCPSRHWSSEPGFFVGCRKAKQARVQEWRRQSLKFQEVSDMARELLARGEMSRQQFDELSRCMGDKIDSLTALQSMSEMLWLDGITGNDNLGSWLNCVMADNTVHAHKNFTTVVKVKFSDFRQMIRREDSIDRDLLHERGWIVLDGLSSVPGITGMHKGRNVALVGSYKVEAWDVHTSSQSTQLPVCVYVSAWWAACCLLWRLPTTGTQTPL